MAFSPRSRTTIRDDILAELQSRYSALGKTVLTIPGSDAYMLAEVLGIEIEGLEAQALQLTNEILPDKASRDYLDRHGTVDGVGRTAAIAAVLTVQVTGTPSATVTFGSSVLVAVDGTRYTPNTASVVLDGSGNGTTNFTCQTAGIIGNQPNSTVLTWSSTPANANATATVTATVTTGTDEESNAAYAARIIARRQERPASGNRADWRDWARAVSGVSDAYVYPLLHATYGVNTPGALTLVALGPAQGDSTTNSRLLNGTKLNHISGYIEGTNDKNGVSVTNGTQLRPVTIPSGAYSIEAATFSAQNVDATVVMAAAYPYPWSGTMTVDGSSTSGSLVVNGDQTAKNGLAALVFVGTSAIRGGYQLITLPTGTYNGGTGKTTFTVSMLAAPSGTVYPAPPNWSQIRTAVFGYFDSLGPGDTSPAARWPTQETQGRSTLYRTQLQAVMINGYGSATVTGVLSATVTTPAADVTPAAKAIVSLGSLIVHA